jgi:hypothetical protein
MQIELRFCFCPSKPLDPFCAASLQTTEAAAPKIAVLQAGRRCAAERWNRGKHAAKELAHASNSVRYSMEKKSDL